MVVEKSSEGSAEPKLEGSAKSLLYQCYVDVSELLLPGSKEARTGLKINITDLGKIKDSIYHVWLVNFVTETC